MYNWYLCYANHVDEVSTIIDTKTEEINNNLNAKVEEIDTKLDTQENKVNNDIGEFRASLEMQASILQQVLEGENDKKVDLEGDDELYFKTC